MLYNCNNKLNFIVSIYNIEVFNGCNIQIYEVMMQRLNFLLTT